MCGDVQVTFFHGHGQFSDKTYRQVEAACGAPSSRLGWKESEASDGSTVLHVGIGCAAALAKMSSEIGGYYSYNLYDECWYENIIAGQSMALPPSKPLLEVDAEAATVTIPRSDKARLGKAARAASLMSSSSSSSHNTRRGLGAVNDYVCGGPVVQVEYLNITAVKRALHVPDNAFFFQCDNGEGFNYHGNTKELMPFYRHVIEETDLRVLVYNGDADPGLNSFYAQNWTAALGYEEKEAWRPWTLDGKEAMGGYVTRYVHDFDYLTIRGAGHMVPEYQSRSSLEFIKKWLKNEEYQGYKRNKRLR